MEIKRLLKLRINRYVMKLILLLSKEHLKLAQDEAIAIIKPSKVIKNSNLLILETNNPEKVNELAYTKRI